MELKQWMLRARIAAAVKFKDFTQSLSVLPLRSCQPFIILGHPRSGSTLLHTLLNSHPQIYSRGEWLGMDFAEKISKENITVIAYLRKGLQEMRAPVRAVGFKVFYEYSNDEAGREAINWLSQYPNLKVIHLERQNLLQQYVSLQIASQTQQWSMIAHEEKIPIGSRKIHIDLNHCLQYFEERASLHQQYEPFFATLPQVSITYEALVNDQKNTLNSIADFLGVSSWPMTSPLLRQNPEPWQALVTNAAMVESALIQKGYLQAQEKP